MLTRIPQALHAWTLVTTCAQQDVGRKFFKELLQCSTIDVENPWPEPSTQQSRGPRADELEQVSPGQNLVQYGLDGKPVAAKKLALFTMGIVSGVVVALEGDRRLQSKIVEVAEDGRVTLQDPSPTDK